MTDWRVQVSLLIGTAVSLGTLWCADIPFGIPGEWVWERISVGSDDVRALWLGLGIGVVSGAVYIGCCVLGLKRVPVAAPAETAGWLAFITMAGFFWLFSAQSVSTHTASELKSVWVLYDPGASGYFTDSVLDAADTQEFLAGYEAKMASGDVFHIGTHPPGLFLANRILLAVSRQSPAVTLAVLATQPAATAEAFADLERRARLLPRNLDASERAALWLSSLLTQAIAAAAVIPIFLLVSQTFGSRAGWKTAAFWPLVPALAVFLPKSDALFPFLGTLFLWLWVAALCRKSFLLAAAGGLVFWVGTLFSLALLPVGLLAVLYTCWRTWMPPADDVPRRKTILRHALLALCAAFVFLAATAVVGFVFDLNLFRVWAMNLRNHAAFYDQAGFPRTYWKWLLVNPLELMFAAGWPVLLLAIVGAIRSVRRDPGGAEASARDRRRPFAAAGPAVCCGVVWSILWISGKNMGEAARLWLFLLPWLLWVSAAYWEPSTHRGDNNPRETAPRVGIWILALSLQLLTCLLTVSRVSGFHFGQ